MVGFWGSAEWGQSLMRANVTVRPCTAQAKDCSHNGKPSDSCLPDVRIHRQVSHIQTLLYITILRVSRTTYWTCNYHRSPFAPSDYMNKISHLRSATRPLEEDPIQDSGDVAFPTVVGGSSTLCRRHSNLK